MTIFIVDDDADAGQFAALILTRAKFQAVLVTSASQAVRRFSYHHKGPGAFLLAARVSGIPGPALLLKLRPFNPHFKVTYTLTHREQQIEQFADGPFDVLTKPFTPAELIQCVHASGGGIGSDLRRFTAGG